MNPDRIRLSVEDVGITALVLSLVGFEIKQTRDMNLAQLQLMSD